MSGRSFETWRAQLTTYLLQCPAEVPKSLLLVLKNLQPIRLASFLVDLHLWADNEGMVLPKELLPTTNEVANWLR